MQRSAKDNEPRAHSEDDSLKLSRTGPKIYAPGRHSPQRRPSSMKFKKKLIASPTLAKDRAWTTAGYKGKKDAVHRGPSGKLRRPPNKRPWSRALPELNDLREDVHIMKQVEADMVFRGVISPPKSNSLVACTLSSYQKQKDNKHFKNQLGRFPRGVLFHPLTTVPKQSVNVDKWISIIDDGTLAWIALVNSSIRKFSMHGGRNVGDIGLNLFSKMSRNLVSLNLKGCKFSPQGLQAFGVNSSSLRELVLDECHSFDDDSLYAIAKGSMRLNYLSLRHCRFLTDAGLCTLAEGMPTLTSLILDGLPLITDKTVHAIVNFLGDMKHLSLIDSMKNITDSAFEPLVLRMKSLVSLNIPSCINITNLTIQSLVQKEVLYGYKPTGGLPNMVSLDVSGCPNLNDLSISWLAAGLDGLQVLKMSDCPGNFELGCRNLGHLKFLTELDISSCPGFTDKALEYMALGGSGRQLRILKFRNMSGASDTGIHEFVTSCTKLHDLDVSGSTNLSDVVLAMILRECKLINTLAASGLPHLGENVIKTVRDYCPGLTDINISYCDLINDDLLDLLSPSKTILKIDISGCPLLGDSSIARVPNWWLTHLVAKNLTKLTDPGIVSLSQSHLELLHLDISNSSISNKGLLALKTGCKKLTYLNLYGCNVSEKAMRSSASAARYCSVILRNKGDDFVGFRSTTETEHLKARDRFWAHEKSEADAVRILCRAYRAYRARRFMRQTRLRRRKRRWLHAIVVQKYLRRFICQRFFFQKRYRMTSAAVKIQFIFRRFVRLRAYRKALIFWKLGTERHYFYTWMIWTETTISQRTVADARAQERKANFFARHVFEKTWMIPILRKWSKWGKDQVLERKLRNDSNARAMAFFKNHTQLIFFRQWKSNAKIMPFHRKKLVVVFLQCVDISSYNSTRHMRPVAKAVDQYNKTIRLRYRHAIFDVLHQHVLDVQHAMEKARYRSVMIFRNRAQHAVIRTWTDHVQNRLYKKRCVVDGEAHYMKTKRSKALSILNAYAKEKIATRKKLKKAYKYWSLMEESKMFKGWTHYVDHIKTKRAQTLKAIKHLTRLLEVKVLKKWVKYLNRRKYIRVVLTEAAMKIKMKVVYHVFSAWLEVVEHTQITKVKLLMRWRKRELAYFFKEWYAVVIPIIHARHDEELAAKLKLAREEGACIEIQRVVRGFLAFGWCVKHRVEFDWSISYIQGWWRICLARKVRRAKWRHRHLKDWKKAELEHPAMLEEERISWELDAWWKAATFVCRCYRGYLARKYMYTVRKKHQNQQIDIHNEKSRAILEEAQKREAQRAADLEHKVDVVIRLQCMVRCYNARKILQHKWQGHFYRIHAIKIQTRYRQRYAIHRAAAKARWLVMRKKVRAQVWRTALMMKIGFGAGTKVKQEKILKALNGLGLHPEGFVLNPFKVVKEVIFDIYYAQREVRDMLLVWKEGGFNSYRRMLVANRLFDEHLQADLPRKGDAVRVLLEEYKRRGESGYILNVKTICEGTNAERKLALVKFDKSGEVDWVPFKQEATAYSETLPALHRIPHKRVKIMDVDGVKQNKVALLAHAETALELRKEYRAARLVQMAFRAKRSRRITDGKRQKMKKLTAFRIKFYKRLLRVFCFSDNASTREMLIRRKIVNAKYLPKEMYPENSGTPKWLRVYLHKKKLQRIRRSEIDVALKTREHRVRKVNGDAGRSGARRNGGGLRERMIWRIRSEKVVAKERKRELRRRFTSYPLANFYAKVAGKDRYTVRYKFFSSLASFAGGKTWKMTKDEKNTWAGAYKFENMHDSPHVTANGLAMYHGVWNDKGQPHGQGYAMFLKGDEYATPSSKAGEKEQFLYHTIEGFFENGRPMGAVYIMYKDKSVYEGYYNGEPGEIYPPPKHTSGNKTKKQSKEKENRGEKDEKERNDDAEEGNKTSDEDSSEEESREENSNDDKNSKGEEDKVLKVEEEENFPYKEKYQFLKHGIRNRRKNNTILENESLLSPAKVNARAMKLFSHDAGYDPRSESELSSSYTLWESSLVRKPRQMLIREEFESFVRIGTPEERVKLELPPPLDEIMTPGADESALVPRRGRSTVEDSSEEDGFSRPGTAMTGIFTDGGDSRPGTTQNSRPSTSQTGQGIVGSNPEVYQEGSNDFAPESETSGIMLTNEMEAGSDSEDKNGAGGESSAYVDDGVNDASASRVDNLLPDILLEDSRTGTSEYEDALPPLPIELHDDTVSVASTESTQSYDEKYMDKDWGIWTTPIGERYEGYLVDNNFDPKGKNGKEGLSGRYYIRDKYDEVYDGELVCSVREGKGIYRYDDGTMYEGDWRGGKKDGLGRLEIATGEVYDGSWKDDLMHGYGVHMFTNGDCFEGHYRKGKWEGYGNFVGGNGEVYNGCYVNNLRCGLGRMVYIDGGRYEGSFKDNVRNGTGTFYLPWKQDEDPGMRFLPNGTPTWYRDRENLCETYVGPWVDDRMDGEGLYHTEMVPGGWVKNITGLWVRGVRMKVLYIHPYETATNHFCEMLRDVSQYRQPYGMSVVEKFPMFPDGVNGNDPRIPNIVKGLLKAWRTYKWEISLIGRTLFMKYDTAIEGIKEDVVTLRNTYRELRFSVKDAEEELEEQIQLVEEELEAKELAYAQVKSLEKRIQTYWDTDEIQEDDDWERVRDTLLNETEPDEFRLVNLLVKSPNPIFEKMMKIICLIFDSDYDWLNIRIMCSESERAMILGDKSAITRGPYKVKLYDEIRRFDVYRLAADKERLELISDLAYDPLLQPSSRMIKNVTPCAVKIYNFIKPTLLYALEARKLLPWKEQLKTALLDYDDCKMSWEDEAETLTAIQADQAVMRKKKEDAREAWRTAFHESQKSIIIYEKIKRLRSGRDKNLNMEALKQETPPSTEEDSDSSSDSDTGDSSSSSSSSSGSSDSNVDGSDSGESNSYDYDDDGDEMEVQSEESGDDDQSDDENA